MWWAVVLDSVWVVGCSDWLAKMNVEHSVKNSKQNPSEEIIAEYDDDHGAFARW